MLSIDGVHIENDLGLHLLADSSEPILPDVRENTVEIPGRHGVYAFDSYLGSRRFFERILIPSQADLYGVQRICRSIGELLLDANGQPKDVKLVYDYEPDKEYIARFTGYIAIDRIAKTGLFPIPLTAYDPYAQHTVSTENIIMDSDTSLLSDVPLDAQYHFDVKTPQTIQVHNFSYYNIRPTIEIQGSFTSLTLSANGKGFSFGTQSKTIVINGENYTVLIDGENSFSAMSGDFLEFTEGYNDVEIDGTGLNVQLTFKFKPKYM